MNKYQSLKVEMFKVGKALSARGRKFHADDPKCEKAHL